MKTKKIVSLILAVVFVLALNASVVFAEGSGDVIKLTGTSDSSTDATVKYHYQIFSREPVIFAKGDHLVYDVYLDNETAGLGSIEIWVSGASPDCFRDIASWKDQNDVKGHPNADISKYAYHKWYTRKLPVPDSMDGATAIHWDFGIEKLSSGETYTAYYDNIKVLDKDGNVKATVYESGDPAFDDDNGGPGYQDVHVTKAAAPAGAAPAGDSTETSPKTGDFGLVPFALLAVVSASGALLARKKKE